MPGALVPEANGTRGFVGPAVDAVRALGAKFTEGSHATLTLDFVMLDDGAVFGPDMSNTLNNIIARKEAAERIVTAIQAAAAEGKSQMVVLDEIEALGSKGPNDYVGVWRSRIVRQLKRAPGIPVQIEALSRMPSPPTATLRKNTSEVAVPPITPGPRLVTWSCSPPSCVDEQIAVYAGIVSLVITGICNNGARPGAQGQVAAYCTLPVTLEATGYPEIFGYGYDRVNAEANAYDFSGNSYWFMYNESGCDGYNYFYADPPTTC
jgi:hypothetical protein